MNTNDLNTALYEKMAAEQDKFRDWLKSQPPEEVSNHAYEYTIREDIVMAMEELELTDTQAQALLESPSPLADVYRYFEKLETGYMDVIRDSIESRADDVCRAKEELRTTPVYPHSAAYASEHGEMAQYNLSYQANSACKEAIEQTISAHYAENRLDTEAAVKDVLEKFGTERVQFILANTIQHKNHDGRISQDNKAWAKTIALFAQGSLQPADLVICIILSLGMITPLTTFANYTNEIKSIQYAVMEAEAILELKELSDASQPAKVKDYSIELKDVAFSYNDQGKMVLEGLNLLIPEKSFTALVGPSGGGKSTIARLIARFWDVTEGSISIGGVNIKDIPLEQLSDLVSFVTQDNFLFDCSILENIRLGNPKASDEDVYAAARAACCDEFVNQLERGYHTTAGEAGGRLSGGERQRIAIARAILKNAPIVILDEATAFTDPQNEDKIQRSIAELTKGKTLLVIAHRLSTIKNANQIVVLDQGKAEAVGTHEALLQSNRLYKTMWEAHINAKGWSANKGVL